jgi:hypothetical protein
MTWAAFARLIDVIQLPCRPSLGNKEIKTATMKEGVLRPIVKA